MLCVQFISDPVQTERLVLAVMGSKELAIEGLLDLIQNNQSSDSCRYCPIYQQYLSCFLPATYRTTRAQIPAGIVLFNQQYLSCFLPATYRTTRAQIPAGIVLFTNNILSCFLPATYRTTRAQIPAGIVLFTNNILVVSNGHIQNNQSSDSCRYCPIYQQYHKLFPTGHIQNNQSSDCPIYQQ